jgi:hypothetical protein
MIAATILDFSGTSWNRIVDPQFKGLKLALGRRSRSWREAWPITAWRVPLFPDNFPLRDNAKRANLTGAVLGEIWLDSVERDKWYFVVDCGKCDCATVLGEAPSPKEVARPTLPDLRWRCPRCGKKQSCRAEQVQRCEGIYI